MKRVGGVVVAAGLLLGAGLVVVGLVGEPGPESGSAVDIAPLVVETPAPAPSPTAPPVPPSAAPPEPVAPPVAPAVPLDDDDDDDGIPDDVDDDD